MAARISSREPLEPVADLGHAPLDARPEIVLGRQDERLARVGQRDRLDPPVGGPSDGFDQAQLHELLDVARRAGLRDAECFGQLADREAARLVQGTDGREQAGGHVEALGARELLHLALQPLAEALEPAAQGQVAAILHEIADHVRLQLHEQSI